MMNITEENKMKRKKKITDSAKSVKVRIDRDFDAGDLVLFKNINWKSNSHLFTEEANFSPPAVYMAFISDSSTPCFLEDEQDIVQQIPNKPKWIVGEVVSKELAVLPSPRNGLVQGDPIISVLATDLKEVPFDDTFFRSLKQK